jgi:ABC-type antimicrobial peptide transport system permease subunit
LYFNVRVSGDPAAVVPSVRSALRELDPNAPITEVATGTTLLSDSLAQPRHLTFILTGFSALALILATIGLYGITTHWVQRRSGDIAIRIALGGSPGSVLTMVLRQGLGLVAAGLAIGAVAAMGVGPMMTSLLYEASPQDPRAIVAVVGLLLGVWALACLVPAQRAVRVDPGTALRQE